MVIFQTGLCVFIHSCSISFYRVTGASRLKAEHPQTTAWEKALGFEHISEWWPPHKLDTKACLNTLLLSRPFQHMLPNKPTELQDVRVGKVLTVSIPYIAFEFQHAIDAVWVAVLTNSLRPSLGLMGKRLLSNVCPGQGRGSTIIHTITFPLLNLSPYLTDEESKAQRG